MQREDKATCMCIDCTIKKAILSKMSSRCTDSVVIVSHLMIDRASMRPSRPSLFNALFFFLFCGLSPGPPIKGDKSRIKDGAKERAATKREAGRGMIIKSV